MDRNVKTMFARRSFVRSLSARRAWIEMANALPITSPTTKSLSARRAWIEIMALDQYLNEQESLSARRAWIEMSGRRQAHTSPASLSARRAWIEILTSIIVKQGSTGRSPQGERG